MRAEPARLNSAIAWLFMLGASCFALGTIPAYFGSVMFLVASTYAISALEVGF
jgi:hypothetical protein